MGIEKNKSIYVDILFCCAIIAIAVLSSRHYNLNLEKSSLLTLSLCALYGLYRFIIDPFVALALLIVTLVSEQFITQIISSNFIYFVPFLYLYLGLLGLLMTKKMQTTRRVLLVLLISVLMVFAYQQNTINIIVFPLTLIVILFFLPEKIKSSTYIRVILIVIFLLIFKVGCFLIPKSDTQLVKQNPLLALSFTHYNNAIKPLYSWDLHNSTHFLTAIINAKNYQLNHHNFINQTSPIYQQLSNQLYWQIMFTTPADVLTRVIALIQSLLHDHLLMTLIVLIIVGTIELRFALILLLFIVYFPTVLNFRFNQQQYFYLSFLYWMPMGFLISQVLMNGLPPSNRKTFLETIEKFRKKPLTYIKSAIPIVIVLIVLLGGTEISLLSLRYYQTNQVKTVINTYQQAPIRPLSFSMSPTKDKQLALLKIDWPKALFTRYQQKNAETQMIPIMLEIKLSCSIGDEDLKILYAHTHPILNYAQYDINLQRFHGQESLNIYTPVYFVRDYAIDKNTRNASSVPVGILLSKKYSHCVSAINEVNHFSLAPYWLSLYLTKTPKPQDYYLQMK